MSTAVVTANTTPEAAAVPLTGSEARKAFVKSQLPVSGCGLEIAPYFNPLIDSEKHDVFYVDCIDNDEIRRKANDNPDAKGRYVPRIDAVWVPGKRLAECVGGRKFAYAVASHVLEHVPNPLGWLEEILECVAVGGRVAIILPLRTQSMDYYRQTTTFGQIVGWSIERPSRPTPTQVMDFLSQSFFHDGEKLVEGQMPPFTQATRHYSDVDAIRYAQFVWNEKYYLDVHCSTWTPESFTEIFRRLHDAGLLSCKVIGPFSGFPGATHAEFLAYLEKVA